MKKGKITKRQLKEDEFVQATLQATSFLQDHLKHFIIGVVTIAVIVGGVYLFNMYRQKAHEESSVRFHEAYMKYQENNLDEALKLFQALAEDYSSMDSGKEALFLSGNIHYQKGQFEEAEKIYTRCARAFNDDHVFAISAREGIAACLEAKGKYEEAAKAYEEVAERYNTDAVAPRNLMAAVRVYETTNNYEAAKKLCQEIIDKYAKSPEKQAAEAKILTFSIMVKKS